MMTMGTVDVNHTPDYINDFFSSIAPTLAKKFDNTVIQY